MHLRNTWLIVCLAAGAGCTEEATPSAPLEPRSSCWNGSCCPTGTTPVLGTDYDDTLIGTVDEECLVADGGDDTVIGEGPGDRLLGGPGSDDLRGGDGHDTLYGNTGDDTLLGGGGNDTLVPGPGLDTVHGDEGDDTVVIHTSCELSAGEVLDGGPGNDTLITPRPVADLVAEGVIVQGFEAVTIQTAAFDVLECCEADTCGDEGTCSDPDGAITCTCNPGFVGRRCQWDAAAIVDEFETLADPVGWQTDAVTGLRYRRTTAQEQERNEWLPGSFLVELDDLDTTFGSGPTTASLLLPLSDASARTVELNLLGSDDEAVYVEVTPSGTVHTRPTFFFYGSRHRDPTGMPDLDDAVLSLVAIDDGGMFQAKGEVLRPTPAAPEATTVRINGPNPHWQLDAIGGFTPAGDQIYLVAWYPSRWGTAWHEDTPNDYCYMGVGGDGCDPLVSPDCHPCEAAKPPGPPANDQCQDQLDNDGDGEVDEDDDFCNHSDQCNPLSCVDDPECDPLETPAYPYHAHTTESGKTYGLFGDIVFCTRAYLRTGDWKIWQWSQHAYNRQVFDNGTTGNPDFDDYVAHWPYSPLHSVVRKCWVMGNYEGAYEDAKTCRDGGGDPTQNCGPFDQGAEHRYPYDADGNAFAFVNGSHWNYFNSYLPHASDDLAHAVQLAPPNNSIDQPVDFVQLIVHQDSTKYSGTMTKGGVSDFGEFLAVTNGYWILDDDDDIPNDGDYTAGPHEIGHLFGCGHCDADYIPDEGWTVMVTEGDGEDCAQGVNTPVVPLFSDGCAQTIYNGFQDRGQPTEDTPGNPTGPYFGW